MTLLHVICKTDYFVVVLINFSRVVAGITLQLCTTRMIAPRQCDFFVARWTVRKHHHTTRGFTPLRLFIFAFSLLHGLALRVPLCGSNSITCSSCCAALPINKSKVITSVIYTTKPFLVLLPVCHDRADVMALVPTKVARPAGLTHVAHGLLCRFFGLKLCCRSTVSTTAGTGRLFPNCFRGVL